MDIVVSWNITAISFTLSTLVTSYIAWRAFSVWREDTDNKVAESFFKVFVGFSLYVGVRAVASIFFPHHPPVLAAVYTISHIFQGAAAAYIIRLAIISFYSLRLADRMMIAVFALFALKVVMNLLLPSTPHFNEQLNIIEWGQHSLVGVAHVLLLWAVFLTAAAIFLYKAVQHWRERIIRIRSLLIASSLLFAILVVIPRNIFPDPVFIFVSDIGFVIAFGFTLWAITYREKEVQTHSDGSQASKTV